jgi:hypothetical protein
VMALTAPSTAMVKAVDLEGDVLFKLIYHASRGNFNYEFY